MVGGTFFGVILKPNIRYEQRVTAAFTVSKACLAVDPNTIDKNASLPKASVFLKTPDGEEFIICHLGYDKSHISENLEIKFDFGEKICFKTKGTGTVHLTGWSESHVEDTSFRVNSSDEEESEEEEISSDEEADISQDEEVTIKKEPLVLNNSTSSGSKKRRKSRDANTTAEDESIPSKKPKKEVASALDKLLEKNNVKVEKVKNRSPEEISAAGEAAAQKDTKESEKEGKDEDDSDEYEDVDSDEEGSSEEEDESCIVGDSTIEAMGDTTFEEFVGGDSSLDDIEDEEESDEDEDDEDEEEDEDDEEEEQMEISMDKGAAKSPKVPKSPKGEKEKTPKKVKEIEKIKGGKTPKSAKKEKTNKENDASTVNANKEKTPGKKDKKRESLSELSNKKPKTPKRTIKGGIIVEDLKVGTGDVAEEGKTVGMYYEGKLKNSDKAFDSTLEGKPLKFKLGAGQVIKGWELGLEGIKAGGKRRLSIPPNMAYGAEGAGKDIPPNSHLVFDVECKYVK